MELEDILRVKVELLTNGIYFSPEFLMSANKQDLRLPLPRKGGAGPAGGMYFRFSNGSIVNAMAFSEAHPGLNIVAESIDSNYKIIYKLEGFVATKLVPLFILPTPEFYMKKSNDRIGLNQIALLHGDRTLASTINQRCMYWRGHQQCRFCAIETSLDSGSTIEKKTGAQLVNAIQAARDENPAFAQHLTLTTGTLPSPDKGMAEYIDVVKIIKATFPDILIHIQIEPLNELAWFDKARTAGVDTVGIHIEILDDIIRTQVCPGKSLITKAKYIENWKYALEIFGENQVNTFILTGFESNLEKFYQDLEDVIQLGVIPEITPVRAIPILDVTLPKTTSEHLLKTTLLAARLCLKYGVDPTQNKAGCIRCEGCSAIIDAFRLISQQ